MTRWILAFALLGAAHTASAQNSAYDKCMERNNGHPDGKISDFCHEEEVLWKAAYDKFVADEGVDPYDHSACLGYPLVYLQQYETIEGVCNQDPDTGRDMSSCGEYSDFFKAYVITINNDTHLMHIFRLYKMQMNKRFWLCTERTGPWPFERFPAAES